MNGIIQRLKSGRIVPFRLRIRDDRGVTYVEVVVTVIMVVAAVVVTLYSLYFGNRSLDVDMHKQQALRIVQEEMEYWIGRMYTSQPGDPSSVEMAGKTRYKSVLLDKGTENQIEIWLSRDPITVVYDPNNFNSQGYPLVAYWIITIWAEWEEPDGREFQKEYGNEISLTTYAAPQS